MASYPSVNFIRMRWTNTQGGRESGVCASSGSIVTPSVARVSTEYGVQTLKADARWCMCGPRGSCACSGTVTPPLFLRSTPFSAMHIHIYIYIKIKIHSSCEIECFVETHLCKLCVILRSRVLRVVCPHEGYRSAIPVATTV